MAWSSTSRTLSGAVTGAPEGVAHADAVAARDPGTDVDPAVVRGGALADAELAQAAAGRAVARAAVVDDLHLGVRRRLVDAHDHRHGIGGRVATDVGERLLHRAEDRETDAAREPARRALLGLDHVEGDREALVADLGDQAGEVADARVRRTRLAGPARLVLPHSLAQGAEQAAHLRDRVAGGLLDVGEGRTRGVGVAVEHPACGAGLDAHRGDAVGDHVVQLAGDAQPLVDDRLLPQPAGLACDGGGLLLEPVPLAGRAPRDAPADDRAPEVDRVDDQRDRDSSGDLREQADPLGAHLLVDPVLRRRADGELPADPGEHEEHDHADGDDHRAPVARPRHAREQGEEVDDLQRRLAHDLRHRDAGDEHVPGGEESHRQRPAAAAEQQCRAAPDREPLRPHRDVGLLEAAGAAHQLEGQQADRGDAHGQDDVRASEARPRALPHVVDAEPVEHALGRTGHGARVDGRASRRIRR